MKKDERIKKDVKAELEWGSRLNGSSVKAEVNDGIVTLTGHVDSYPKKVNICKAIEQVKGVISVISFLEVRLPLINYRTDREIERSVMAMIKWNSAVVESEISCKVVNGVVILEGTAEWEYQQSKAGILAGDITGVIDVKNLINVSSTSRALFVQKKINSLYNNRFSRPGI